MNKRRMKNLTDIVARIEALADELREALDAETAAFEAMPESLQGSERGERSQSAIDYIEEAASALDDAVEAIHNLD